jgi:hypothetical protein
LKLDDGFGAHQALLQPDVVATGGGQLGGQRVSSPLTKSPFVDSV